MKRNNKGDFKATHGHTTSAYGESRKSRTYQTWENMRSRCYRPKTNRFRDYGGKGIQVCARWFMFENFLADMGERPVGKTIDRINSNGHYMPSNCRWLTPKEQCANRRSLRGESNPSHILTHDQVVEIKNLIRSGSTQQAIANQFGVCKSAIGQIRQGKNWKHVK